MEQVVLLDESGSAVGTADKAGVHHADTPLHLAFSCYVFNRRGELLVTRRALGKRTWPGVWTNTCCGHPGPGEDLADAVRRRLRDELGVTAHDLELALPAFRYRAEMPNGVVENEMCPVFHAVTDDEPTPNPDEVADTRWVPWVDFTEQVLIHRAEVSPWCARQLAELVTLGTDPAHWPPGDPADLPPAAR